MTCQIYSQDNNARPMSLALVVLGIVAFRPVGLCCMIFARFLPIINQAPSQGCGASAFAFGLKKIKK